MQSEEQIREMEIRRNATLNLFLSNLTLSDKELSDILNANGIKTSSSTVGRDLSRDIISKLYGEEIANKVDEARKNNQLNGRIEGGLKSQELYGYAKDENGEFIGSGIRRG